MSRAWKGSAQRSLTYQAYAVETGRVHGAGNGVPGRGIRLCECE